MNPPDRDTFLTQMRALAVTRHDPYIRVYPAFVNFFTGREMITKDDFVIAANFTYGWMPTILNLAGTDKDWRRAARLLTNAKQARVTSTSNLLFLVGLMNNSLVGASKILHFVNPKEHAIWDGRVYRYLTNEEPYGYRVGNVDNFLCYLKICDDIAQWPELMPEVEALSQKLGQILTPFRAIELTMFVNGGSQ